MFLLFFLVNEKLNYRTWWSQFTYSQWFEGITLLGYFDGLGDAINGTTCFSTTIVFFI